MAHLPVFYFFQKYSSPLSCYVFPFLLFPTSICRVHSCIPFCVSLMFSNFSFMSYLSRFLRGVFPFMCLYMPWHIILFPSWSSPISGFHPPGLLQAWVISEALIGFLCFGKPPFSICRDSFCCKFMVGWFKSRCLCYYILYVACYFCAVLILRRYVLQVPFLPWKKLVWFLLPLYTDGTSSYILCFNPFFVLYCFTSSAWTTLFLGFLSSFAFFISVLALTIGCLSTTYVI